MLCNTSRGSLEMLGLKYLTCAVSKPNITKQNIKVKAPSSPLIRLAIDFCDCSFYSSEQANICHPAPALLSPPFWLFLLLFRPSGVPPLTLQVPVTWFNPIYFSTASSCRFKHTLKTISVFILASGNLGSSFQVLAGMGSHLTWAPHKVPPD